MASPYLLWVLSLVVIPSLVSSSRVNALFAFLFVFRYLRLVVHTISFYFLYEPTPIPADPTLQRRDCTIIIPTIDPENAGFQECLQTVLANQPGAILIVTVGAAKLKLVKKVVKPHRKSWPSTTISVTQTQQANKRRQVCHAIPLVRTPITVLVDDHVYWPSLNFLPTILAPFEDPHVGGLGTNKVVRRDGSGYGMNSIFNFLGCVYLERHNFEIAATNALDGGVFVLSGRTSAHRTCILQDQAFINGFSNEMFLFNKLGPINPDDDNFITRWEVKNGWKLKIQYCPDATIETDLGNPGKYLSQCLRWVRTTWRSNSCSLFTDRTVWHSQPWCVYAVYLTSFFNFALFYDAALMIILHHTTWARSNSNVLAIMASWIFISKMIKLLPHFWRCPSDLLLIPAYIIFAYYHSLMKLWALFTFYECAWGGRNLAAVDASANDDEDEDNDDSDDDTTRSQPVQIPGYSTTFTSGRSHDNDGNHGVQSRSSGTSVVGYTNQQSVSKVQYDFDNYPMPWHFTRDADLPSTPPPLYRHTPPPSVGPRIKRETESLLVNSQAPTSFNRKSPPPPAYRSNKWPHVDPFSRRPCAANNGITCCTPRNPNLPIPSIETSPSRDPHYTSPYLHTRCSNSPPQYSHSTSRSSHLPPRYQTTSSQPTTAPPRYLFPTPQPPQSPFPYLQLPSPSPTPTTIQRPSPSSSASSTQHASSRSSSNSSFNSDATLFQMRTQTHAYASARWSSSSSCNSSSESWGRGSSTSSASSRNSGSPMRKVKTEPDVSLDARLAAVAQEQMRINSTPTPTPGWGFERLANPRYPRDDDSVIEMLGVPTPRDPLSLVRMNEPVIKQESPEMKQESSPEQEGHVGKYRARCESVAEVREEEVSGEEAEWLLGPVEGDMVENPRKWFEAVSRCAHERGKGEGPGWSF